jgi:hypothetical protein
VRVHINLKHVLPGSTVLTGLSVGNMCHMVSRDPRSGLSYAVTVSKFHGGRRQLITPYARKNERLNEADDGACGACHEAHFYRRKPTPLENYFESTTAVSERSGRYHRD